jgi:hypothetical protein
MERDKKELWSFLRVYYQFNAPPRVADYEVWHGISEDGPNVPAVRHDMPPHSQTIKKQTTVHSAVYGRTPK